ncbi:conserved oligomeric Golgi complex subunit 3 isoform X1 [Nasonia vitripennis]|uniref:Conserved oligomeric Golgi complex subunit 3 n=1 Tax=Nasonia vitripennis TaxID=7425 RepID=A0A7M7T6N8_NASVI|nr:conserved oligomeric Golgi complex subunit 3 isoform X1 [Nasonia vitripennis]XP_031778148.1 conserved oligomeric Golgi complex subunit 3 isoform X1 [Nasonia vitripennis]
MAGPVSVPDNLVKWDLTDDPLAPLTADQKFKLALLADEIIALDPVNLKPSKDKALQNTISTESSVENAAERIESYQELLLCYSALEQKHMSAEDVKYISYLGQLKARRAECHELCMEIERVLDDLALLSKQYTSVSEKTTSLHTASEQLTSDQEKLITFVEKIAEHIKYFKEVDFIMDKLDAPTLSVNSEIFFNLLNKIDNNMDFMQNNPSFKESNTYLVKYRHCQSKAITLIQNYIFKLFTRATESILNPKDEGLQKNPDAALALFYGRFQSILPKAKPVIEQVEAKSSKRQEYESLLFECHQHFLSHRGLVLGPSVQKGLQSIKSKYNGDHCSLVRHSCSLLLHASIDEYRLFYQFFSKPSPALLSFSESLCTSLYDTLRPFIIHINHLETLAEICCILRIEMLDEHVQNNTEPLQGFGNVCLQLLHDVQERLVFRAHLYLQSDVAGYNPSPGDLAYPEKLKMMEDIAESIREDNRQKSQMKKISLSSLESGSSSGNVVEPISRTHVMGIDPMYQRGSNMGNSPADLHGMWYPTVRRTLVCLSRLYRCVDRPVFQSLSQEAITYCVQSIEAARERIQSRATPLDAELFQVKHLLILREQIAPFQVDFTVKEYSLDFSKVKSAAFGLLEKRSRLFTLSNNALLEFLLEGAPQMKEQLIDSRKHVDAKLKSSCQRLIQHITRLLIDPVVLLLERSKALQQQQAPAKILGSAENVAAVVSEALRLIKFKLPAVQQSMQLYLANRETECILFRPIKNNIVAAFAQLQQLLSQHYSGDELLLIACPLPEQVSVMLSSSALAQAKDQQQQPPAATGLPEAKDQVTLGDLQQTRQQRLSSVETPQELVAKQQDARIEGHKSVGGIENV